MRLSSSISVYLVRAVIPYFFFAWVLLSVILFVQQASRFYDIFFSANIPASLVWQLTLALVPNVISFTCPMAALVGVIIGLSRMQGDSELVAIRAAGVANWQIMLPMALLGILLSVFGFLVNLKGVPIAASIVRRVALQTALSKLESPIEPGVFNSEVAGFTIYVKGGDIEKGSWKNIFLFNEDPKSGIVRLITADSGRIDLSGQNSELVLDNAVATTITPVGSSENYTSEQIGEVRYAVQTRRSEIISKLSGTEMMPDELGLNELSEYARGREGRDRIEAEILWNRRILLSITPLIFALLGTSLVLRFDRKGRGFGISAALLALILFYLFAFLGEQLARTEVVPAYSGSILPIALSIVAIAVFLLRFRTKIFEGPFGQLSRSVSKIEMPRSILRGPNIFVDITTGLRDFDIVLNLLKYYLLTLGFLSAVFVIFTGFELWKFAGTIDNGIILLIKYLYYLLPFIYIQLAPSAAMIAILATFVIKSRSNEIVTWTAAGESIYRLLLPCMVFAIALGLFNWQVQERIMPAANHVQDELRTMIRSRGAIGNRSGKLWVASANQIFSFELESNASDNENTAVANLAVYEFAPDGSHLQSLYRVPNAVWTGDRIKFSGKAEKIDVSEKKVVQTEMNDGEISVASNPFVEARRKPSHLNAKETTSQIKNSEAEIEQRSFGVALQKKYSTLVLPLVIALFTAPFALSLNRKGKVVTVGYAVGLWLILMGVTSTFEQFGLNGTISPEAAVWGPLMLFALLGVYLMTKVRT